MLKRSAKRYSTAELLHTLLVVLQFATHRRFKTVSGVAQNDRPGKYDVVRRNGNKCYRRKVARREEDRERGKAETAKQRLSKLS